TFLNNRRISKSALKDDDVILIGKHTVTFKDTWHDDAGSAVKQVAGPAVPKMEATMVLDTKKAKEMIAAATAGAASAAAAAGSAGANPTPAPAPVAGRERTGTLAILDGKTDQKNYVLGKMSV